MVDKAITIANIKSVEKNFPDIDKFSIEKNPVAKFFFVKLGLGWGSLLYGILSIITFLIALILLEWTLKLFHISNSFSIALYAIIIFYGIVIFNNLFFLLKFSKIIP